MSNRPTWTRAIVQFMDDEVMDDKYEWPPNGEADELVEEMLTAVRNILCREYGHDIEHDHCGIPSHQHCIWCHRGIIDINHMEHARVCSCLNDAAECCVESCPCPRVRGIR